MVDPPSLPGPAEAEGDEAFVLTGLASATGVSVAELGSILDAILPHPCDAGDDTIDAGDDAGSIDAGSIDAGRLWRRIARMTWGDDAH